MLPYFYLILHEDLCNRHFFRTTNKTEQNDVENERKTFVIDDMLAEEFETYMKNHPQLYQSLAQRTREHLPTTTKKPAIVDLGAGPGLLALELAKRMPRATIFEIDSSLVMLKRALKNAVTEGCRCCHPVVAQGENLPLRSHSIDIVVSRLSLSTWGHPQEGFKELCRVMKPGGKIFLETLNKEFPRWKRWLTKLQMRLKGAGKKVIRYHDDSYDQAFSITHVEQLFIKSGFTIVAKEGKPTDWKFLIIAEKHK